MTEPLSLFPDGKILFDISSGSTKQEIVAALLNAALADLDLSGGARDSLLEELMEREGSGSTGMGQIAIPHVKSARVPHTVAAIGVFADGVEFQAVDGAPVGCVFLLVSPENAAEEHVALLRWIAGVARKRDFAPFIRRTADASAVHSLLLEMDGG